MNSKKEVTAIIPCRKGSLRIPSKNLLPLGTDTLLSRKIKQLKNAKNIDRIVVGSDDDLMLDVASNCGVEAIRRPDFYCDEKVASANDMIANMMDLVKTDIVVWSHCTNPLLSSKTYDNAVDTFINNFLQYGINNPLSKVAALPTKASIQPELPRTLPLPAKLDKKHPIVNPITKSFLKKHNNINNSLTLNCINP